MNFTQSQITEILNEKSNGKFEPLRLIAERANVVEQFYREEIQRS